MEHTVNGRYNITGHWRSDANPMSFRITIVTYWKCFLVISLMRNGC